MDNGNSVRRVMCPMENVSTTFQSLDTVRALHQTVVSLRSALEEAKFEIQRLRSQISSQSEIKEGAKYRKTAEEPSTNKDVDLDEDDEHCDHHNKRSKRHFIKESTVPPVEESQSTDNDDQQPEQIHQVELRVPDPHEEPPSATSCPHHHEPHTHHTHHVCSSKLHKGEKKPRISIYPDISVVAHPRMSDDNSKQMASKIDVKIKVMSNIKVDGSSSDTTSASQQASDKEDDSSEQGHHHHHHHGHSSDGGHHLHTTSDDSIKTHKGNEGAFIVSHSSKEDITVDDNENSQSEGDNSVFIETKPRKTGGQGRTKPEAKGLDKDQESKEEVDDIELIFSSDENRDPIQEDLVSISEYYPFQNAGNSGTPVLLKFASLPSDQEPGQEPSKSATLPTSTTCDVFFDPDSAGLSQDKSLESNDSFENQCTKSSSLDKENSLERKDDTHITRDESLDFFDNRDLSVNRKWTNYNVLVETDISKCGIVEETTFEMYRRNTCPNPPAYRPPAHRDNCLARHIPSRLASRYCRRVQYGQGGANSQGSGANGDEKFAPKRSSSAQTEISALPDYWKSESQLAGDRYHMAGCTLPSKFVPTIKSGCHKHSLRISERTQEARRVLLSDINFTSMVPELSRSADHLCQEERRQEPGGKQSNRYYKGNLLKTPDYALKGITPSVSMTSPGVSQWTVNESSFGTQTIQTAESWGKRGDSFDSCKSYSTGSRYSGLDRHHRSRSVPSFRCAICKQAHGGQGIRTSESMHYTPRVTFQEPACKIRGSLPDLRHDCVCSRRYTGRSIFPIHGDSSGSTESLLDEADTFVRKSTESAIVPEETTSSKRPNLRRMSETDIQRDYIPSKQSLPFLPKTAKCLKPGHLAKVISKSGRVVVGRVRYVGPLATVDKNGGKVADDLYVGVQLQSKCGDCDGTYDGRKFFDCEPLQGLFVPFKKVVMAWTA